MTSTKNDFQFPKKLEKFLASLAAKYRKEGDELPLRIIVNSHYHVVEEYSYDNWNGGQSGHALYFQLPEALYHEIMENLGPLAEEIKTDLNRLNNVLDEYIAEVFLELEDGSEIADWRERSGYLMDRGLLTLVEATIEDQDRLWDKGQLRVFLSHKAEFKTETKSLKDELRHYGVACFVAHEDIEPTKKWLDEIERALLTMKVMVALLTEKFDQSNWTDQEIGIAIGRGIPVVSVRIGKDPYGFIGKYQGMSGNGKDAKQLAKELFELFLRNRTTKDIAKEAFLFAVEKIVSFEHGNALAELLPDIDNLSGEQVNKLLEAYNGNRQARDSYGFNGASPSRYGRGLAEFLSRITGDTYRTDKYKKISRVEPVPQELSVDADVPF